MSFFLRGNASLIGHHTPPAVKTEILKRDVSKGASKHDGDRWMHREPGGEGEKQQQHESHNQRLKPDSENIPHLVILVK